MTTQGPCPKAGVIGWPVAQSLSPHIHGHWLSHYGLAGAYDLLPVAPENLPAFIAGMAEQGLVGANVTVPHKVAVLDLVDQVSDVAKAIGAVNTLYFDEDRLVGTNSDAFGFFENLREGAPSWQASGGPAVVLGAGGAARAVIFALLDAGVPQVRLTNRTIAKAQDLASHFGERVVAVAWEERETALSGANLLVNSTSLGMAGQPPLPLRLEDFPTSAVINDIVYKPLETELLRAGRLRGNPVVDGLGMLLHQARAGFKRWFGTDPQVTKELRRRLLDAAT